MDMATYVAEIEEAATALLNWQVETVHESLTSPAGWSTWRLTSIATTTTPRGSNCGTTTRTSTAKPTWLVSDTPRRGTRRDRRCVRVAGGSPHIGVRYRRSTAPTGEARNLGCTHQGSQQMLRLGGRSAASPSAT